LRRLTSPFGRTRRIRCNDGTERVVYRNIDHVYPLEAADRRTQGKLAAAALDKLKASVDVAVQTHVAGLYFQLDEANLSMQSKLRTTYVVFCTDPCSFSADWLHARTRELMDEETVFRRLVLEIHRLQALVSNGVGDAALISEIAKSLRELAKPIDVQRAAEAIREVEKTIDAWQEGLG